MMKKLEVSVHMVFGNVKNLSCQSKCELGHRGQGAMVYWSMVQRTKHVVNQRAYCI